MRVPARREAMGGRSSFGLAALGVVLGAVLVGLAAAPGRCDRGHLVIQTLKPNVSVNNAGQKAIIGWNGREEVLILATDLSAGAEAKVVEFLPLPSKPSDVSKAERQSFSAVEMMIAEHAPVVAAPRGRGPQGGPAAPSLPVEIVFHKQIEAHDITIARTADLEGFVSWAKEFVRKCGGRFPAERESELKSVVGGYLKRGYQYFVFDVIDLAESTRTVPPISYRFASDHLFFPLVVSTLDVGETEVSLFLFTPQRVDVRGANPRFAAGVYERRGGGGGRGGMAAGPSPPIGFSVRRSDLHRVSTGLAEIFEGWTQVRFTAARYAGPVGELRQDFVVRASAGELSRGKVVSSREEAGPGAGQSGGGIIMGLAWSPDGDRLCVEGYPVAAGVRGDVVSIVDVARGESRVVASPGWVSGQCWSPDGRRMCYVGGRERNVWVAEAEGGQARQVTDFSDSEARPPMWRAPAWSPSGEWIAFGVFGNLWLVKPDGTGLERITELPEAGPAEKAERGYPGQRSGVGEYAWSPDGKQLVYSQLESPAESAAAGSPPDRTLHVYDVGARRARALFGGQRFAKAGALCWQPGGDQFAFYGQEPGRDDAAVSLWMGKADGSKRKLLSSEFSELTVEWTRDGRRILVRGFFPGVRGYEARLVEVGSGKATSLGQSHFLSDTHVQAASFRPGSEEVAAGYDDRLILAGLDGSGWREIRPSVSGRVEVGKEPGARWREDPAVGEVARQWQVLASREGGLASPERDQLCFGVFHDLYDTFDAGQQRAMEGGEAVPCARLTAEQRGMLVRGLAYRAVEDLGPGADPLEMRVPEWYWWLEEGNVRFSHQEDGGLSLGFEAGRPGAGGIGIPLGRREDFVFSKAPIVGEARAQGASTAAGREGSRGVPWEVLACAVVVVGAVGAWAVARGRRRRQEGAGRGGE
jgi:hypothetical protein